MCGIAGYVGPDSRAALKKTIAMLSHRGPDDLGIYLSDGIGLANARLSIIDIEGGHQPLAGEDDLVWVTFNGELFNFPAERSNLERKGHRFRTNSDTEILVHLYEEHGPLFAERLNGMFAFAIWDERLRTLYLARDYAGMKPLYYTSANNNTFWFASEIKALLPTQSHPSPNVEALSDFLRLGYIPDRRTMFRGIFKLGAGQILKVSSEGQQLTSYHKFHPDLGVMLDDRAYEAKLRFELNRAADDWLMSDVPVGCFLSGGLDSSLVAALVAKRVRGEIRSYTAWFGPDFSSELRAARAVAEKLSLLSEEVLVGPSQVVKDLRSIAWSHDEPVSDPAVIPTFFVSKEAARNVKVVFAGEGADELFGGYPHHRFFGYWMAFKSGRFHHQAARMPQPTSHLVSLASKVVIPGYSFAERYLTFQTIFEPELVRRLAPSLPPGISASLFAGILHGNGLPSLNLMLLCDTMTRLAESYMMKADKATMAHSVEERSPYLDKPLMDFAFSVPARLKITPPRGKLLLRKVAKDLLPRSIVRRRKVGYGVPVRGWVRSEVGECLEAHIFESQLVKSLMDQTVVSRIVRSRQIRPYQFWLLGSLALWDSVFFRESLPNFA
ncbi:MAG TPA: asparagine synthase (glutamine-hydrolyzing) [Thermoplasmata archaeon]